MYYIYHIEGIKIGCTKRLKERIRNQHYSKYEVLEEHSDIYIASKRERELQKEYGYKVDSAYYWETLIAQKHISNEARVRGGIKAAKVNGNRQGLINAKNGHMKKMVEKTIQACSIPIIQCDKDGNFIRDWDSAAMAARELGLHKASISRVCNPNNPQLTSGGYTFQYK